MMELFSAETSLRPDTSMTKDMNFDSVPTVLGRVQIKTSNTDSSKVLSYRKTLTNILKIIFTNRLS